MDLPVIFLDRCCQAGLRRHLHCHRQHSILNFCFAFVEMQKDYIVNYKLLAWNGPAFELKGRCHLCNILCTRNVEHLGHTGWGSPKLCLSVHRAGTARVQMTQPNRVYASKPKQNKTRQNKLLAAKKKQKCKRSL